MKQRESEHFCSQWTVRGRRQNQMAAGHSRASKLEACGTDSSLEQGENRASQYIEPHACTSSAARARTDLTDGEGRVWNYVGEAGSGAETLRLEQPVEPHAMSPIDLALLLRPQLLLNGKVYRLSDADVLELALPLAVGVARG